MGTLTQNAIVQWRQDQRSSRGAYPDIPRSCPGNRVRYTPGFYKNYLHASIQRDQTAQGVALEAGGGTDAWALRTSAGERVEFKIAYQRGVPARSRGDSKPRAAAEPSVWRIYRFDQGVDVVRSIPASINRLQKYEMRVTLGEFRELFDGSEKLVSAAVLPWYHRQTLLP